ncbi:hypothetical protein [Flavobacterium sp.]|uniref:hypothetical protein n=1 Tax=Flavobacterium sp. TaxID=239 RepID=UPI0028BEBF49|nr:hypothetical protein [Flavobacterium sp.]
MTKRDFFIGVLIGFAAAALGCFLFLFLFTDTRTVEDLRMIRLNGYMGKLITLGAIFNLIAFFLLLKYNKDYMARGVILATLLLALLTVIL